MKLPDGVPPAIGKSFSLLLPIMMTLGVAAIANIVVLAPAIASTGWAVTAQQSVEINSESFMTAWTSEVNFDALIAKEEWSSYSSVLTEMKNLWGSENLQN
ncbi:hypothetical protein [Spiroplasma clarkii]|uniref:hypothetical protein n=1 Tax=Spiroplasma clarkii TaxID=2139 RepID=UPI0011BA8E4B|nr:hypothetical protein [Spiroplasma clarkii]